MSDRNGSQVSLGRARNTCGRSMPHSAAIRCDVNLAEIVRVENNAIALFEVITPDARPMGASVCGPVSRRVGAADVKRVGIARIDGESRRRGVVIPFQDQPATRLSQRGMTSIECCQ